MKRKLFEPGLQNAGGALGAGCRLMDFERQLFEADALLVLKLLDVPALLKAQPREFCFKFLTKLRDLRA